MNDHDCAGVSDTVRADVRFHFIGRGVYLHAFRSGLYSLCGRGPATGAVCYDGVDGILCKECARELGKSNAGGEFRRGSDVGTSPLLAVSESGEA
jgi:hypothetical protein